MSVMRRMGQEVNNSSQLKPAQIQPTGEVNSSLSQNIVRGNSRSTFRVGFRFFETNTRLTSVIDGQSGWSLYHFLWKIANMCKKLQSDAEEKLFGLLLQPGLDTRVTPCLCCESIPRQSSVFHLWLHEIFQKLKIWPTKISRIGSD